MSFTLFLDRDVPAVAVRKKIIKAHELADFTEADALLRGVRALKAEAEADIAARRASAETDGRQAGLAEVEATVSEALSALTARIDAFEAERRDEIAGAAFAAVRAVIGTLEDETVLQGLVAASLSRIGEDTALTIEVAPVMLAQISAQLEDHPNIALRANEALGPLDCHIVSPQGRIVADLQLQLDALAERWGVDQ